MNWDKIQQRRELLKDNDRDEVDFAATDQAMGIPMPGIQKPFFGEIIALPSPAEWEQPIMTVAEAIAQRRSRRLFAPGDLKLAELSYLLWATGGIRSRRPLRILRNTPSAGNRHSEETYLAVFQVEGLKPAIYRYLPLEHGLGLVKEYPDLAERVNAAARMQVFASRCSVLFLWTTLPYRMEWRYDFASAKVIALDIGHICQNLYLACESIGCGTCALAAYDQKKADALLGVDGEAEFTVYMAPVGIRDPRERGE